MRQNPVIKKVMQTLAVLAIAGTLKLFYSTASVNDLRWILAPTAFLVEIVTGETFRFESYSGYMNGDYSFLIAASCSGVNFLITAFLMLSLVTLWRNRAVKKRTGWQIIPTALLVAYLTTIVVNTVRIAVSLRLHRMGPDLIWINPEQAHRFEGIFIYFGFLLLLFVLSESIGENGAEVSRDRSLLRRSFIPLLIYWVTTLGVPVANGALRSEKGFIEHAIFVLLTPLILVVPLAAARYLRHLHRPSWISTIRRSSARTCSRPAHLLSIIRWHL